MTQSRKIQLANIILERCFAYVNEMIEDIDHFDDIVGDSEWDKMTFDEFNEVTTKLRITEFDVVFESVEHKFKPGEYGPC